MKKLSPSHNTSQQRAVFLDRDGVLTRDKDYTRLKEFELLPGVGPALRTLKKQGFLLIVITNQSGVARGFFPVEEVNAFHQKLQNELQAFKVQIDAFYMCPHHPEGSVKDYALTCECRKPHIGMIEQAKRDFPIDLDHSYLVGDKESDMECAKAARIKGIRITSKPQKTYEAASLVDAMQFIR